MKVLDPGVGTGEFLSSALDREPELDMTGWDTDPTALATAGELVPEATLEERSAILPRSGEKFDLVVGNPPYFQFKATSAQKRRFGAVISGRPNIFAFFFQAGLEALVDGGQLAFVVPPSLNNGAYFESLREYLIENAVIEHLEVMDGSDLFEGANTAVQLIVLRKDGGQSPNLTGGPGPKGGHDAGPDIGPFTFTREVEEARFRRVIFTSSPSELARQFKDRRTLWELGYQAATGRIVWNQNRELLRTSPGADTVPLVWARNLTGDGIRFDGNPDRPENIITVGLSGPSTGSAPPIQPSVGPAVLVNRVVGAVGKGELRAATIPGGERFLAENHVNVLTPRPGVDPQARPDEVACLINGEGVSERVRLLTGNSQISAKELTHLLPL